MSTQRNNPIAKAIRFALIGGAAAAAVSPVFAAEEAAEEETRIEVTGSRIKRTDIEGANPVQVLDRQAIEATGLASVGDILQDIPSAGSSINTTFNNGGDGSTTIDLRNLGSQRVLVLLNGRRWNTGLGGTVDLNNIPSAIVERIEVLKDGASAIYGSDAIAGVVNIITRKDYEGAYANAYFGENQEGDGRVQQYDFGVGAQGDKGGVFLAMSYLKQDEIMAGDRDISAVPVYGAPVGYGGSSGTPDGRFIFYSPGFADSFDLTFDNGAFRNFVNPDDLYNFAPENYLQTPSERANVYVQANYNITDSIQFETEMFYGNRKSAQLLAPTPLFVGYFGSGLGLETYIAADNAYNPFGYALDATCSDAAAGCMILIGRRMREVGPRIFNQDVDQYQWNAGFNGSFEIGDRIWDWDINNIYGYSHENDQTTGLLNMQRVNQALAGPAACNAGNGCVELNLFGGEGSITQDMANYISFVAQDAFYTDTRSHSINLSGELFDLPAGPVGVALGFETRRVSGYDQPDALIAAGITSGNARQPTSGKYSLDEYYVEFAVPLLADMPGAELLELSLATRTSDYSNFGSTDNGSVGIKYKPVEELLIRGTYAEGFRAPTISELFLGNSDSFPTLADPCSNIGSLDANANGTIDLAEATAAGIPGCAGVSAGYVQPNSQIRITVGGNENLEPEESTSKTFGMVWSPAYIEGFELALDFYDYEVTNNIGTLGAQTILNSCAEDLLFCNFIDRTATGNVADLFNGQVNTGEVQVTGYDLSITYKLPETSFGSFKIVWDTSYMDEYVTRDFDAATGGLVESDNFVGVAGDRIVIPEYRSNINVYWNMGDFDAVWRMRYLSSTTEACDLGNGGNPSQANWLRTNNGVEATLCSDLDPNTASAVTTAQWNALQHENELEAALYHDISFGYNIADINAKVTVGGVNVLDEEPALSISTFANSFDPTMYDVPGAFWYVRYSQNF
ncbi:MAG: TonB-dependent receptor plug domain-containing protein [Pseudomonadota bacterium]